MSELPCVMLRTLDVACALHVTDCLATVTLANDVAFSQYLLTSVGPVQPVGNNL